MLLASSVIKRSRKAQFKFSSETFRTTTKDSTYGSEVGVILAERPRDGVHTLTASVPEQDGLHRDSRVEGAQLVLDELAAVGVGALGEDEDLRPVPGAPHPLRDGLGGALARLGTSPVEKEGFFSKTTNV